MKNIFLLSVLLFVSFSSFSQKVICSLQDKNAFENKISEIYKTELLKDNFGERIVTIGKTFLKTPYVAKTLEIGTTESLVVNLQGLDCTTFVENVLVFSLMSKVHLTSFEDYIKSLENIRYIDGKLEGYASRLHYFSEWITNNEKKGLVKNITANIGGMAITKEINFMSTHRNLYPFLKDEDNYKKIQASENYLNNEAMCILPQNQIESNESLIQSGDIIALTTSIKGLDITHTGIATREKDERIHLLHASSKGKAVEVSKLPLADYLKGIKNNTGIIVVRPQ
ncbi:MAG: N-acetylmuramoyl-L-alanine amidase-like domain-containing protein [Cellulophaga sp.]